MRFYFVLYCITINFVYFFVSIVCGCFFCCVCTLDMMLPVHVARSRLWAVVVIT